MKHWVVYMVECRDGSLYTGMTNDIVKRIAAHNAGKGAKYTRSRRPVKLRYIYQCMSRRHAATFEASVKSLPRAEKLEFIRYQVQATDKVTAFLKDYPEMKTWFDQIEQQMAQMRSLGMSINFTQAYGAKTKKSRAVHRLPTRSSPRAAVRGQVARRHQSKCP